MSINGLTSAYNGIDIANVNKVTADILNTLENKRVDISKERRFSAMLFGNFF